jgi:nucleoside-diphosphate-sugar epimerase
MDEQGYRQVYVQGLQNVLAVTQPTRRLFWTSSTSVFGQSDGSEVDELSPCEPRGFAGRVQLEAEQVVLSQSLPATVLRLGGVYGPGRTRLIQQVRDGVGTASEPVFYSNRIHVADAAAAFGHLMALDAAEQTLFPLYLGVDGDSSPLAEVKHWLAQRMGLQDHWKTMAAAKGRGGSKRCSNERLRQSGFSFQYASFRQGYGEMLAEMGLLKPDAAAG